MFIMDEGIQNLLVHVSSKNKDLGNRTLSSNGKFNWEFREGIGDSTVFKGNFFWMNPDNTPLKELDFNVFDTFVAERCRGNIFVERKCFWLVKQDGAYFAKDNPSDWQLMYADKEKASNVAMIKVVVHKRPLNKKELAKKEKDIISIAPYFGSLTVYESKVKVDLTEYVKKHGFVFDAVMNEDVTNDEVGLGNCVINCHFALFMIY
ncbi:Kinesin, motor domain-containing protein [Artemisia annua]|uniref:Kinesin, motor domain-containing protein n=1 Tax=Artemisia annua TaxID=35608 RepID=A0A2U1MPT8_ARTAN|nr:Kinesin, motor domain-containing protein [Artemisia annua]